MVQQFPLEGEVTFQESGLPQQQPSTLEKAGQFISTTPGSFLAATLIKASEDLVEPVTNVLARPLVDESNRLAQQQEIKPFRTKNLAVPFINKTLQEIANENEVAKFAGNLAGTGIGFTPQFRALKYPFLAGAGVFGSIAAAQSLNRQIKEQDAVNPGAATGFQEFGLTSPIRTGFEAGTSALLTKPFAQGIERAFAVAQGAHIGNARELVKKLGIPAEDAVEKGLARLTDTGLFQVTKEGKSLLKRPETVGELSKTIEGRIKETKEAIKMTASTKDARNKLLASTQKELKKANAEVKKILKQVEEINKKLETIGLPEETRAGINELINKGSDIPKDVLNSIKRQLLNREGVREVNEALGNTVTKGIKQAAKLSKKAQLKASKAQAKAVQSALLQKNTGDLLSKLAKRFDGLVKLQKGVGARTKDANAADVIETLSDEFLHTLGKSDLLEGLPQPLKSGIEQFQSSAFPKQVQDSIASRFKEVQKEINYSNVWQTLNANPRILAKEYLSRLKGGAGDISRLFVPSLWNLKWAGNMGLKGAAEMHDMLITASARRRLTMGEFWVPLKDKASELGVIAGTTGDEVLYKILDGIDGEDIIKYTDDVIKQLDEVGDIDTLFGAVSKEKRKELATKLLDLMDNSTGKRDALFINPTTAKYVSDELTIEHLSLLKDTVTTFQKYADILKLPKERRVSAYIPHFLGKTSSYDKSQALEELVKIGKDKGVNIPNKINFRYLNKRFGDESEVKSWTVATKAYSEALARKQAYQPFLDRLLTIAGPGTKAHPFVLETALDSVRAITKVNDDVLIPKILKNRDFDLEGSVHAVAGRGIVNLLNTPLFAAVNGLQSSLYWAENPGLFVPAIKAWREGLGPDIMKVARRTGNFGLEDSIDELLGALGFDAKNPIAGKGGLAFSAAGRQAMDRFGKLPAKAREGIVSFTDAPFVRGSEGFNLYAVYTGALIKEYGTKLPSILKQAQQEGASGLREQIGKVLNKSATENIFIMNEFNKALFQRTPILRSATLLNGFFYHLAGKSGDWIQRRPDALANYFGVAAAVGGLNGVTVGMDVADFASQALRGTPLMNPIQRERMRADFESGRFGGFGGLAGSFSNLPSKLTNRKFDIGTSIQVRSPQLGTIFGVLKQNLATLFNPKDTPLEKIAALAQWMPSSVLAPQTTLKAIKTFIGDPSSDKITERTSLKDQGLVVPAVDPFTKQKLSVPLPTLADQSGYVFGGSGKLKRAREVAGIIGSLKQDLTKGLQMEEQLRNKALSGEVVGQGEVNELSSIINRFQANQFLGLNTIHEKKLYDSFDSAKQELQHHIELVHLAHKSNGRELIVNVLDNVRRDDPAKFEALKQIIFQDYVGNQAEIKSLWSTRKRFSNALDTRFERTSRFKK